MAELGVAYISVLPDTSKLAPAIAKSTNGAAAAAGSEGGKTFGSRFTSAIGGALKTAGRVGLLAAGAAAGATLVGGFKSAIDQAQSEKTLEGLYGSAKKAEKIMTDLRKVSKSSPIDYKSYTSTAEALAYMGVKAKDAAPMLDNMGKMIVGAGGGSEELERAGDAMLKMVNSGKVYAADLNQLSDTGIPVFSSLAEHLGTNIAGVRKMVSEGKVGIEDVQYVMQHVTGETAKKQVAASKKVTGTLSNQFKMLKDNIIVSLGGALRGLESFGAKALKTLNGLFSGKGGGGFKKLLDPLRDALNGVLDVLKPLGPAAKGLFGDIVSAAKTAAPAFVNIGKALAPVAKFVASAAVGALVIAFKALGPVVKVAASAFAAVAKWMANNRDIVATLVAGLVAYKAVMVAQAAVTKGVAAATKAYAIAQRVLNAAMKANPIGLVVTALTLLAGAAVVAYKRSATFRKIVNGAWAGIRKVVGAVWGWMKKTLWPGVKGMFSALGSAAKWFWNKAIKPAFHGIRVAAGVLWKGVKLYFSAWKFYFTRVLFPVIKFLWSKVVRPVFRGIGKAISAAWNGVIKPIFGAIGKVLRGDLSGAFNDLKAVAGRVFNFVVDKVKQIPGALRKVGGAMKDAGKSLVGKLWDGLTAVGSFAADLGKKFANAIIDLLNKAIPNKIPVPLAKDIPLPKNPIPKLARGGIIVGPGTATSDSIPAMLSNGEYVISAAMVKKYGPGLFDALNAGSAKVSHFASGGLVGAGRVSTASDVSLTAAVANLVRVLKSRVVPALTRGSGPVRGARGAAGGGKDLVKGFKKATPVLKGFHQGLDKTRTATIGMEKAVGKSSKRIGKTWAQLRKGGLNRLSRAWGQSFSKDMPKRLRGFDTSTSKTVARTGKRLGNFIKGPVRSMDKSWRDTMTSSLPKAANTMDSRVRATTQRTSKGLRNFGSVVRSDVPKAFRKGVDAVGGQWDRVRGATRKPVKFVVQTVLNKGLIAAFNKIAKFVDTKTLKKISLPKGFARGGFTGPGHKYKPAGIVHAGEYVINKESTSRLQREKPGLLDALNRRGNDRGMVPPKMPGYWTGGGVMPLPSATSISKHPTPYYGAWYAADMNGPYDGTMRAGIVSWKDGKVAYTKQRNSSYGYETVINHPDGNFTRYAHQLPGSQVVRAGQAVRAGQRIGAVGETGNAHGAHLHFEIKGGKEAQAQGLGGVGSMLPAWAQKIANKPKKWAKGLLGDKLSGSGFADLGQGVLDKLIGPSADWATEQLGSAAYSGPMSGSVKRFIPTVKKVLAALGEKAGPTLMSAIMARMQKESGGNVGIVNLWDSNAAAGHPSVGLMQVIGPTYQANKPNPDKGPYKYGTSIDPFSNIYAGLNYARGRYGSIYRGMTQPGGYDNGGWLGHNSIGVNTSRKPEPVFSNRQWATLKQYVPSTEGQARAAAGGPQQIVGTLDISPNGQATIRGWAAQEMGSQQSYARGVSRMGGR